MTARLMRCLLVPLIGLMAVVPCGMGIAAALSDDSAAARSASPDPWDVLVSEAEDRFGERGRIAAEFLREHRPERDADIDSKLVIENIEFALRAKASFAWAGGIDENLFLNDVLPYAVIDEPRDRWRAEMFELASEIVTNAEASSAAEAVQALNRDLFQRLGVRYSTERKRANQNVSETTELGMASCTGLSIMLVNACRAVGIPARLAGIASWPGRGGNHAWVEIWDGRRWRYTGAAEYDENCLDRAWFNDRIGSAIEGHIRHGVRATSWQATGNHYPLPWNPDDRSVPGVDVTHRYGHDDKDEDIVEEAVLALRLWNSRNGERLSSHVRFVDQDGKSIAESETYADPADTNRVAELPLEGDMDRNEAHRVEFSVAGEIRIAWIRPDDAPSAIIEVYWDELSLTRQWAGIWLDDLWDERASAIRLAVMDELEQANVIRLDDEQLRIKWRRFEKDSEPDQLKQAADNNDENAGERLPSMWISLHGGGNAPTEVNDRQWENQSTLYEPDEGIYVAPRAPSDTWNMWHRAETDRLLDRLIEAAITVWNVDPDRVYLLGYSAGGDGVYRLAPRMADRLAAAAMMAGHPNDATPYGLRNLPFAIFMGAEDAAYNRNEVAKEWDEKIAALREDDPKGYPHLVRIYEGLGHWMDGRDAEALPWMAQFKRDAWPSRVIWRQGNVPHERFYWLAVSEKDDAKRGRGITASVSGQHIEVKSDDLSRITLLLSDDLVNLDEPLRVKANGETVFEGRVPRTKEAIRRSLELRADPNAAAAAILTVSW